MTSLPLSFGITGTPSYFGTAISALGGAASFFVPPPVQNWKFVIQGIDCYASGPLGGTITGYYEVNGTGPVWFLSETMDPAALHGYCGSWRGAIPLTQGGTFECVVETLGVATMGIAAWGVVEPLQGY